MQVEIVDTLTDEVLATYEVVNGSSDPHSEDCYLACDGVFADHWREGADLADYVETHYLPDYEYDDCKPVVREVD